MMQVWAHAETESGYYEGSCSVAEIRTQIDIICKSCERLIYRKEVRADQKYLP